ncbi:unnamed protein product, partial [Amoebophrya sp. A120]
CKCRQRHRRVHCLHLQHHSVCYFTHLSSSSSCFSSSACYCEQGNLSEFGKRQRLSPVLFIILKFIFFVIRLRI